MVRIKHIGWRMYFGEFFNSFHIACFAERTFTVGFNLLGLKPYFWAYFTLLLLLILFRLVIVIEATLMANGTKEYELKSYNKWYIYLAIVGIWYLAVFAGVSISEKYTLQCI